MVDGAPGLLGGHASLNTCISGLVLIAGLKQEIAWEFKKASEADIDYAPVHRHHAVENTALETILSFNPVGIHNSHPA